MEGSGALLCLLLLWAPCHHLLGLGLLAEDGEDEGVTQIPPLLAVRTGDSFNLRCQLTWRRRAELHTAVFLWHVGNQTYGRVASSIPGAAAGGGALPPPPGWDGRVSVRADLGARSSWLVVRDAREQDSGLYRCNVSVLNPLPTLDFSGNGSTVTVQGGKAAMQRGSLQFYAWLLALLISGILLLPTVLILILKRKCTGTHEEAGPPSATDHKTTRDMTEYAEIRHALPRHPPAHCGACIQPQPATAGEIVYSELALPPPPAAHVPTTSPRRPGAPERAVRTPGVPAHLASSAPGHVTSSGVLFR
ncbi:uncharacterized protein LOC115078321 [Rhinatrema bivittatum]|uniref:uncharacterized protein LOC115078321 n=1 Tax=Rhinatrema bivittatum TaxID=194408 RepID=UPI00112B5DF0|nr:uncharacterized protein LOC115078321 [Rhinatrema bivittatum]